jgi:pimeloyl-ACP methyl ester carboxylesterase
MGNVIALRAAIEHPARVASLVLCAVSGGIDVRGLGGAEWRESLSAEQPSAPTWFIDDRSDFTEHLPSIRVPTLVLSGDRDPLSPVAVGELLRARIPMAQLQVVAGGSHGMAYDEPDRVASPIAAFRRESSPDRDRRLGRLLGPSQAHRRGAVLRQIAHFGDVLEQELDLFVRRIRRLP